MKTIIFGMVLLLSSSKLFADEPIEPGSGKTVYTNENECLDNLLSIAGKSYKLLTKNIIAHTSADGTVDILRSNYKISKALPNGECMNDSKHLLGGYNTVLIGAYQKAKTAMKHEHGPSKNADAVISCDNQEADAEWYKEAQLKFKKPKQESSGSATR